MKDKKFLDKCDHIKHLAYVDTSAVLVTPFCTHAPDLVLADALLNLQSLPSESDDF